MKKISKQAGEKPVSALPLLIFMYAAPFLSGLFYEPLSCGVSIFLIVYLLYIRAKRGRLVIPRVDVLLAVTVAVLFYGLSAFWAVDHGMAFLGFLKYLPIPLFLLAAAQLAVSQRDQLLQTVPLTGAAMTILAFGCSWIPSLEGYVLVNSRLAGFFQYPNTFALFLLVGVVLIAVSKQRSIWQLPLMLVLLFGVLQSGSRTAFLLLMALVVVLFFVIKEKVIRLALLGAVVLAVAAAGVYVLATGDLSSVGRFFTVSLNSSTLLGRLLYYKDALPVILRHPFGLGYMGYSFLQGSFQTGVYSVQYIHNDILQLCLDIGWVPAIPCLWVLGKSLLSKRLSVTCRMVVLTVFAHGLLDMNMQFVIMGCILVLAMLPAQEGARSPMVVRKPAVVAVLGGVLIAVSLYWGASSGLYYLGVYDAVTQICPQYTAAWLKILSTTTDASQMEVAADEILKRNQSVSLAHSAKARVSFSGGDVLGMIEHKQAAISLAKYSMEEYVDYIDMLYYVMKLYETNGDTESVAYCRERLLEIPAMIDRTLNSTSTLAWKIVDKPELDLPDEYVQLLDSLQ